jgi:hypothetical protein
VLVKALSDPALRQGARFDFAVPERGEIQLDIFDVAGRRVATIFHGTLEPGPASFDWNRTTDHGSGAAPGVYFARLQGFGRTQLTRMTLLAE